MNRFKKLLAFLNKVAKQDVKYVSTVRDFSRSAKWLLNSPKRNQGVFKIFNNLNILKATGLQLATDLALDAIDADEWIKFIIQQSTYAGIGAEIISIFIQTGSLSAFPMAVRNSLIGNTIRSIRSTLVGKIINVGFLSAAVVGIATDLVPKVEDFIQSIEFTPNTWLKDMGLLDLSNSVTHSLGNIKTYLLEA